MKILFLNLEKSNRAFDTVSSVKNNEADTILYYKDHRTNLCFTGSWISAYPVGGKYVFSHVPCTPEVEKAIEQNEQ